MLTTVAIVGIVLGAFGALTSLFGLAAGALQGQLSDFQPPAQVQASMQDYAERMQEVAGVYTVPSMIGTAANLVISVLLIVCGALILARKPAAIGLMMKTVIAAIVVGLYSTGLGIYVQSKMMPVMQEMLAESLADMPPGAGITPDVMSIAIWAGTAVAVFWLACKLVYYVVTIVTLKRQDTQAWFAAGTQS
jgi:hypothetical protein